MKRTEFLNTLGIGLAVACTGCLASCGKGGEANPGGGGVVIPPPVPPAGVNFNMDLNNDIKAVGDSKTTSGVIVVRLATSNVVASFTAVQVACSHEGTSIAFNNNQGNFVCPNHGSVFNNAGVVTMGPATTNLKKYTIAISGTTLTVTG